MSEAARLLRKAEEEIAQGRLDLAAERFEKILHGNSNDVDALVGIARIALATDSYEQARKFATRALGYAADRVDAKVFAMLALEGQGLMEQALQEMAMLVEQHPDEFLVVFHAGRISAAIGETKQAMGFLNRAAALKPNEYDVEHLRAGVMMQLGHIGEAMDIFRDLMKMEPKRVEGYFGMVDALTIAGEFELAERVLDQARKNLGNDAVILQKRAGLLFFEGDIRGALALAQRVAERIPNSVQAWMNLGMLLLLDKNVEGAESALLKACEVSPQHWEPRFQLGMLYDGAGLESQAITAYTESIERDPNQWQPLNNLGLLLLASDIPSQHARAEQLFRQAIEVTGAGLPDPFLNLALALTKQNRKTEALEICNQLLQEDLSEDLQEQLQRLHQELHMA